jgi:hypothetical protein
MIGLFLPIVIIVIILIFALFSGKLLSAKFLQGNRINVVFTGYLALLLIISGISIFLPVKGVIPGKAISDAELKKQLAENDQIFELVQQGLVDEIKGISIMDEWVLPFAEKELTVADTTSDYERILMFVEKVNNLNGEIEVRHYAAKSYIETVDITERITSPYIKLDDSKFTVLPRDAVDLKFAKLSMPFPFGQFTEEENDGTTYFEGMHHGTEFLYIRVPEGTKVNGAVERIN